MKRYDWNKEKVEEAVKNSFSYQETLRKLGVNTAGNNGETLKRKIKEYGIDISHFTFHAVSVPKTRKSVYEFLTKDSHIQTHKLKSKLIEAGLKENKCEMCGISMWAGRPLICQLHHINGDNTDNRLENLQMLCPNCHSQTDNYCGQANKPQEKEVHYCKDCGRPLKTKNAECCLSCASKRRHRIRITKDELVALLKKYKGNRSKAAKEAEVSETAIRKWCKNFGLPTKSKDLKDMF